MKLIIKHDPEQVKSTSDLQNLLQQNFHEQNGYYLKDEINELETVTRKYKRLV
jgi:hypothetical protein